MGNQSNQMCTYCVMDGSDKDIVFDSGGRCNHCRGYELFLREIALKDTYGKARLDAVLKEIRDWGRGKPYDSILGVSGGIDSSFLALKAAEWGLRPLLVHIDNAYNAEIAERNIANLVAATGFDLQTKRVDLEDFLDMQRAYFRAGVVDIEVVTDHALVAELFSLAKKHGLRHVLSGYNHSTEYILPKSWYYTKSDARNIKAITERFGTRKHSSYVFYGMWRQLWDRRTRKMATADLLNYIDYRKDDAMAELREKAGWEYYGGKHYESVFTRFFQAHILPAKFGIDKRRAHFSNLIVNGQMSRDEALAELENPLYSQELLEQDKRMVLEKLGMSPEEFAAYIAAPGVPHTDFPNSSVLFGKVLACYHEIRRMVA